MANSTQVAAVPQWTSRGGDPVPLGMAMRPPHVIIQDSFEIADYGDDEDATFKHYNALVAVRRRMLGTKTIHIAPSFVM
ncbi:hypothetical protein [Paracidovorax avenae]|uniref:hypothetical protein n=1 Tax=Paracidovorax avenae TaxID=80867 RepID=UPI0006B351F0|nr:hypothetical protein [Paracidovorax avenae]